MTNGLSNPKSPGLSLPLMRLVPPGDSEQETRERIANLPEHLSRMQITARELCQYLDEAQCLDARITTQAPEDASGGKPLLKFPAELRLQKKSLASI